MSPREFCTKDSVGLMPLQFWHSHRPAFLDLFSLNLGIGQSGDFLGMSHWASWRFLFGVSCKYRIFTDKRIRNKRPIVALPRSTTDFAFDRRSERTRIFGIKCIGRRPVNEKVIWKEECELVRNSSTIHEKRNRTVVAASNVQAMRLLVPNRYRLYA